MIDPTPPPRLLVTGMEHSGTTYLSSLLKKNSHAIGGAFECGILLSPETPRNFSAIHPFYDWLCYPIESGHWGLDIRQREFVLNTDSWETFYIRLAQESCAVSPGQQILDKTPAYVYKLSDILTKAPQSTALVVNKNPLLLYKSYKSRSIPLDLFLARYTRFKAALKAAISLHESRIEIIEIEELTASPQSTVGKILRSANLPPNETWNTDLDWDTLPPLTEHYNYRKEMETIGNYLTLNEIRRIHDFDEN